MRADREEERIDTTMGELIAALTDAAFEIYDDKTASYLLASLALEEILKKAHLRTTGIKEISPGYFSAANFH